MLGKLIDTLIDLKLDIAEHEVHNEYDERILGYKHEEVAKVLKQIDDLFATKVSEPEPEPEEDDDD